MSRLSLPALLLVMTTSASAQIHVTRNVLIAPLADHRDSASRLPQPRGLIEAQRGFGSAENGQAWNIRSHVMFQLRPWGARSALIALFGNELTSNPYNDIGYNPRGSIWEENALFFRRQESFDWYAGLFFRSRHELDAATPVNELNPGVAGPTARVIGISGYRASLMTKEPPSNRRAQARGYVHAEGYWHRKEIRIPDDSGGPYWLNATGAATVGGRVALAGQSWWRPYARAWVTDVLFGGNQRPDRRRSEINGRVEIGTRFGSGGGADVFTAFERFFDDLSRPKPLESRVLYIGMRFAAIEYF